MAMGVRRDCIRPGMTVIAAAFFVLLTAVAVDAVKTPEVQGTPISEASIVNFGVMIDNVLRRNGQSNAY